MNLGLQDFGIIFLMFGALQFLSSLWIGERFKMALQKEHSKFAEELKWQSLTREKAVSVAEYLALSVNLTNSADVQKANQLTWEMAMWLPEETYKEVVTAIANPDPGNNILTAVISVRKILLADKAGSLTPEDIAVHGLGIGRQISDE